MGNREEIIQKALADFKSGKISSLRAAATAYGVPKSTLSNRLHGSQPHAIAHEAHQRLTPDQEVLLVDWILDLDSLGFPPSPARTLDMARRILAMNKDTKPLGKDWVQKFKQRHPRVTSCIGKKIDAKRIQGTQPDAIREFYDRFEATQINYGVIPENIWNMDEHGIALGICTNSIVLAASGKKHTKVQAPENREWVTIIETISALGRKTRPVIIFKGKNPQSSWFDIKEVPDWFYTQTENAWTSNDLALAWLCKVFIPETKPDDDSYRILLMDGHGSHETVDFMYECHKHKIRLVYLPPHSSHVLQPLDLGTFASVKSRYRAEIANISFLDDAAPIKKRRFLECYQKIREEAMAPRITQSGWKATGLYPFDRSKGLMLN
jgi:4-hydroxybenzoate polyprenyltransferase